MPPLFAAVGVAVGIALVVAGLYLQFGPLALTACGAVLVVVFLLIPTAKVPERDGR